MTVFSKIIELIQKNTELLEPFIDFLPIGVYISLPEGEILTINDYITKMFEYDSKEEFFSVHRFADTTFANPETRKLLLEILKNEGDIKDFLVEYKTKNSSIIYANENAVAVKGPNNEIEYIIGTIENVTEKVENEKDKIETHYFITILNEALLSLIEQENTRENILNAFSTLGRHLNLSSINIFYSYVENDKIYSHKEIGWINEELKKYVPNIPDIKIDFFNVIPRIAKIVSSGNTFFSTLSELEESERNLFKRFHIKSFLVTPILNNGQFIGFIVYSDSLSERQWKDYQVKLLGMLANSVGNSYKNFLNIQEIAALKSKLETIIEIANIGIWEWDLKTNQVSFNSVFAQIMGIDPNINSMPSNEIINSISSRDLHRFQSVFKSVIENSQPLFTFDFKLKSTDKWLNPIGKVTELDRKGRPTKLMGILLDISERKSYERKIRYQNEKINTILNSAQIMLIELDKNGVFNLISGNLLNRFGLDERYLNRNVNDLDDNLSFINSLFLNALRGNPINLSVPIGDMIIDCKSQAIKNIDEEVESVFITIVDQTIENRYRADIEKTNQQLYAIIDSLPGPVNIVDRNFELMDSNRFLEKGFRIEKPDLIPELENFKVCLQFSTICDLASLEQSRATGKPVQRLTTDKEDEILGFTLIIYTQPIFNEKNEIWAFAQIGLEITELNKTQKLLYETIKTKDKFFDIIAHDLRNPINALNMLIDDLLKNYSSFSLDEIYESNIQIQKTVLVLSQLLNNLLDWSRSQTGRLKVNPDFIDASYIVRNVIEINQDAAKLKNISLVNNVPYGTVVYCDSNMLFTIFRNLVSNAIKYTNAGGIVTIDADDQGEFVEFSVQDNGVGIPSDKIDKLFNVAYVQSTLGTNQEKGSGLGLILCKEFVERNGGTISVASELNKGTTFRFKLPKSPLPK